LKNGKQAAAIAANSLYSADAFHYYDVFEFENLYVYMPV
jgi:hypothetical protein